MQRLFIALALPESVRTALGKLGFGLRGAKWVDPENLHLTLKFLGGQRPEAVLSIRRALRRVRFGAMDVQLGDFGVFPLRGTAPEVLWIGVQPGEILAALHRKVDNALWSYAGIPRDKRKFHAHVTIARLDSANTADVIRFTLEHAGFSRDFFRVNGFGLYSSILNPRGARYTLEEEFPVTAFTPAPQREV